MSSKRWHLFLFGDLAPTLWIELAMELKPFPSNGHSSGSWDSVVSNGVRQGTWCNPSTLLPLRSRWAEQQRARPTRTLPSHLSGPGGPWWRALDSHSALKPCPSLLPWTGFKAEKRRAWDTNKKPQYSDALHGTRLGFICETGHYNGLTKWKESSLLVKQRVI